MTLYYEDQFPIGKSDGFNTAKAARFEAAVTMTSSLSVTGAFSTSGAINGLQPIISGSGATVTLTAAQSGSVCLFDRAAGIVFTLPAPSVGLYFDFLTTVTITSGAAEVDTNTGSVFMLGAVELLTSASATTFAAYGNGTSHVKIASNGTTTGGIKGSQYRITCVSSTVWNVSGLLAGSGTLATPFA
jgi:hypothetical protein